MPSANPRFGVIRVISLTALIVNIAIAILLAPAAWSQSGQSRSQFAYIAGNSFVSAYVIDNTTGALSEINGSPFRTGDWARGVAADPQGRFLYIPNWYSANVSAYLIDGNTGALSAISPEMMVRNAAISPDGSLVAVLAPDNRFMLYPTDGSSRPEVIPTGEPLAPLRWSAKGNAIYVQHLRGSGELPARVSRLQVPSGVLRLWKEVTPKEQTGVTSVTGVVIGSDEESYVYSFRRQLSELYVVDGW